MPWLETKLRMKRLRLHFKKWLSCFKVCLFALGRVQNTMFNTVDDRSIKLNYTLTIIKINAKNI